MAWGKSDDTPQVVATWVTLLKSNDPKLKSLNLLSFRKFTQQHFISLFEAIENNTSLLELYCFGHPLGELAIKAISNSLKKNKTLKFISLGHKDFAKQADLLKVYLDALKEVNNETGFEVDLSNIGLDKHNEGILIELFKNNKSISNFNLSGNELDDGILDILAITIQQNNSKSNLKLDLSGNRFKRIDLFFKPLSTNIEEVNMYDTEYGPLEIYNVLNYIKKTNIKVLRFGNLQDENNSKKFIEQDGQYDVINSIFELTKQEDKEINSKLEVLHVDGIDLGNFIPKGMDNLYDQLSLKDLKLRRCNIDEEQGIVLSKLISNYCKQLNTLDLGSNNLSNDFLVHLLKMNTNLEKLVLIDNNITLENINVEEKDLEYLFNLELNTLDLNVNRINEFGLQNLLNLLKYNNNNNIVWPSLVNLEISGNPISKQQEKIIQFINEMKQIRKDLSITYK